MKKKWTGERLETFIYGDVVVEHLHRYALASIFGKDKVIVDIASGEGYGSYILSKIAKQVIGIDIDNKAVVNANQKYKANNLKYITGSADKMSLEDNSIDVLVSFETIEHHDKHHEMFQEIKRVLKPNGILIMSSPDKKFYQNIQKNNPFHIKELFLEEFETLSRGYFKNVSVYFQNCINGSSVIGNVHDFTNTKIFSGNFDGIFTKELLPLYNIVIASEEPIEALGLFVFDGEIVTNKIIDENENYIRSSTTFKIGKLILSPFVMLKGLFKK
jgi:ubiquinone/menaquinone biosynthesis C-methylase UbiE